MGFSVDKGTGRYLKSTFLMGEKLDSLLKALDSKPEMKP